MKTDSNTLEAAFRDAFAFFSGTAGLDALLDFFDQRALFIDEDHTSVLDKAAFGDHLGFHLDGCWESRQLITYQPRFVVAGSTGVVTTYYTLRGKPVNAGFRLRHGIASVSCYCDRHRDQWRAMSLVLGPMISHIHNASPG